MKTKEELNTIKTEYESLTRRLADLTDDELLQVTGGQKTQFVTAGPGDARGSKNNPDELWFEGPDVDKIAF